MQASALVQTLVPLQVRNRFQHLHCTRIPYQAQTRCLNSLDPRVLYRWIKFLTTSARATAFGKSLGAVFPNATAVLREASTAVGRIGNPSYLKAKCDCPAIPADMGCTGTGEMV